MRYITFQSLYVRLFVTALIRWRANNTDAVPELLELLKVTAVYELDY